MKVSLIAFTIPTTDDGVTSVTRIITINQPTKPTNFLPPCSIPALSLDTGTDSQLQAVVTVASAMQYSMSNSSLKLALPLVSAYPHTHPNHPNHPNPSQPTPSAHCHLSPISLHICLKKQITSGV